MTPTLIDKEALHHLFTLLVDDGGEPTTSGRNLALQSLLYVLLQKVEQIAQRLIGKTDWPNITNREVHFRFNALLNAHFRTQHTVEFYALALNLSPKQLSRNLIQNGGRTAQQLIHDRLLIEAKRLLAYSKLSIKEIAFTIGLEDPAYFSRLFKQKTGINPAAFRVMLDQKSC